MNLKTYLKYNNVKLIDPNNEFHASCISFYNERGFLSPKQVQALRNYVFSVQDINRLTSSKQDKVPHHQRNLTQMST